MMVAGFPGAGFRVAGRRFFVTVAAWGLVAVTVTGCTPHADAPMSQPVEAMQAPWGPFARQCASTRISYPQIRWRVGDADVSHVYETCVGFSSIPSGGDAAEITASVGEPNRPSSTVTLRILRRAGGPAQLAAAGDTGRLAFGSGESERAARLAEDIGLTRRQLIRPEDTLALPVRLSMPFPVDSILTCHPDRGRRDRGRDTLVFACTLDEAVHTDHLDARVRLAGVEEIDVQTGIRLSSVLSGNLDGRKRASDHGVWEAANENLLYRRETEFE